MGRAQRVKPAVIPLTSSTSEACLISSSVTRSISTGPAVVHTITATSATGHSVTPTCCAVLLCGLAEISWDRGNACSHFTEAQGDPCHTVPDSKSVTLDSRCRRGSVFWPLGLGFLCPVLFLSLRLEFWPCWLNHWEKCCCFLLSGGSFRLLFLYPWK